MSINFSEKLYNLYTNEGPIHITLSASCKFSEDLYEIFSNDTDEVCTDNQLIFATINLQNLFYKNPDEINNILGINNYVDIHKVNGGICFEYNKPSYAIWNYKKLKKSPFFEKLIKAFPDITFGITFPWKVWSNDISIYYF